MKQQVRSLIALCAAAAWCIAPVGAAVAQEERPEQSPEPAARQVSDEDRELIEHLDLLEHFELFLQDDLEMIRNLDIFMANS